MFESIIGSVVLTVLPLFLVILLWILALYDQRFANIVYKLHLFRLGLTHLLFSTDRKFKQQQDADIIKSSGGELETKQIIFIRHGESKWNLVFNKGFGPSFIVRLFTALKNEFIQSVTLDSVFVDSPLSEEGCDQAKELHQFIEGSTTGIGAIVKGIEGDSIICSSNLRRALSTGTIGCWERLRRTQEKIHILSCLQEVTFNIDGVALAKAQDYPELCDEELAAFQMKKNSFNPERYYNARENDGNKQVHSVGIDRIKDFAAWCFHQDESSIIAAGHSLYFRYFFDTFLPKASSHPTRKLKMQNCAVVSFNLQKGKGKGGKPWFRIDEESIKYAYLGLEEKKKKK